MKIKLGYAMETGKQVDFSVDHGAVESEIEQVYQHVVMELLSK